MQSAPEALILDTESLFAGARIATAKHCTDIQGLIVTPIEVSRFAIEPHRSAGGAALVQAAPRPFELFAPLISDEKRREKSRGTGPSAGPGQSTGRRKAP